MCLLISKFKLGVTIYLIPCLKYPYAINNKYNYFVVLTSNVNVFNFFSGQVVDANTISMTVNYITHCRKSAIILLHVLYTYFIDTSIQIQKLNTKLLAQAFQRSPNRL